MKLWSENPAQPKFYSVVNTVPSDSASEPEATPVSEAKPKQKQHVFPSGRKRRHVITEQSKDTHK